MFNNEKTIRKTSKEIFRVAVSNFIKLLSGIVVGFLLPKIIGIEDYGYYKTFTLYASYVGIFHFGIVDGIYLKYSGKDYEMLDKEKMSNYTLSLILIEFIITLLFAIGAIIFLTDELRFIFISLSLFLLFNNITGYYQYISQATSRFKELSIRNVIQSLLTIIAVVFLLCLNKTLNIVITYKYYTLLYLLITFILMIWYVITYRDITFNKIKNIRVTTKEIASFLVCGFPLMVSNLCNSLILTIDRQFVNILFTNNEYAIYAFAYNMLTLITTATSAISVVVYPTIKKSDSKELLDNYGRLVSIILIFVAGCLILYYPLCEFVKWFLPKYIDSLDIFRIVLPGLIISSCITIVIQNYYKYFNKNFSFFIKNICILILSVLANYIAYYYYKSMLSISIASVCVMIIWYFIMDVPFIKKKCRGIVKNYLFIILSILSFYFITLIDVWYIGMLIQILSFLVIVSIVYHNEISTIIRKYKK